MASQSYNLPAVNITSSGPLLIGPLLNWGLFGVLSMQVYTYHIAFPKDAPRRKALCYGIYLLEVIQTFMITQSAVHEFAEGFGQKEILYEIGSLWFSVPILNGIVSIITQSFYAYRVYVLSQSRFLTALIISVALSPLGFWLEVLGCSATSWLTKRCTGMSHTEASIKKIIRLTIETASLTATVEVVTVALALLPNRPGYCLAPISIVGKLYSNSMMVVFNSRIVFGTGASKTNSSASMVELSAASNELYRPRTEDHRAPMIEVKVTQELAIFPSDKETTTDLCWKDESATRILD
ncbi:hypothetical protein CPB83DRAFT_836888 [Crepidotus variabilis]|uniref:DUF6534 domain-containing protein n=1 Tax=Crepidotus variabilis TaxID=179855 RepID=A0A9P6EDX4_9AGAR|nr:hypothetical protein CPB83DRAFT_836888 [Crepidotus variabilis]